MSFVSSKIFTLHIYTYTRILLKTYLIISHYATRLDRSAGPKQWIQFPIIHILRQIVDNQICLIIGIWMSGEGARACWRHVPHASHCTCWWCIKHTTCWELWWEICVLLCVTWLKTVKEFELGNEYFKSIGRGCVWCVCVVEGGIAVFCRLFVFWWCYKRVGHATGQCLYVMYTY